MERTISIGQLRQNPTGMIREVKNGAVYTLTDRGQPVADIAPHHSARWQSGSEAATVLRELGPDASWVAEDRHRRGEEAGPRDPWAATE
ncbi:type II toxin-antitoxin system Phd/YefM family antitoxin [Amnibacterium endophyticum]|uniref:Type II toxin-antitoxin system Phd/YefM family antitoxin n=1 Tax=Amnibacterium endophyticum TaxID=2109337 RepID=A0ABW4LFS7_9MICO